MKSLFWIFALSLPILPNLWCIWHAQRHTFPGPDEQKHWVRLGTFVPVLGGLLYVLFGWRRALPLPETMPNTPHSDNDTNNDASNSTA